MVPRLVLDIETVPLARSMAEPYPEDRTPPATYKTDEAIAKWHAADRVKWEAERIKDYSLNPRQGRVLCVGLWDTRWTEPQVFLAKDELDEELVLGAFWKAVAETDANVVTWNGSWDLQFLLLRSLAWGIQPTISGFFVRLWFKKYKAYPHFDCKAMLTNWAAPKAGEGLSEWASFLGYGTKTDGMSGKEVYRYFQREMFADIMDYCRQDVRLTKQIYERIVPYYVDRPIADKDQTDY